MGNEAVERERERERERGRAVTKTIKAEKEERDYLMENLGSGVSASRAGLDRSTSGKASL